MIHGIGVDLVQVSRFVRVLDRFGNKFANRVLSTTELDECYKKDNQAQFLAKRFAAKEAVAKAMGTGVHGFWLTDISIVSDTLGKPEVRLAGRCFEKAKALGISNFRLSISDEAGFALAYAVAEK